MASLDSGLECRCFNHMGKVQRCSDIYFWEAVSLWFICPNEAAACVNLVSNAKTTGRKFSASVTVWLEQLRPQMAYSQGFLALKVRRIQ